MNSKKLMSCISKKKRPIPDTLISFKLNHGPEVRKIRKTRINVILLAYCEAGDMLHQELPVSDPRLLQRLQSEIGGLRESVGEKCQIIRLIVDPDDMKTLVEEQRKRHLNLEASDLSLRVRISVEEPVGRKFVCEA